MQPETVRRFYAEACAAVHAQDPDTPCLIGGAPFYHADTLEIVLLADQPNTICAPSKSNIARSQKQSQGKPPTRAHYAAFRCFQLF